MKNQDHGLTVGELTMAIGAIILASLIWSTVSKKGEKKNAGDFTGKIENNLDSKANKKYVSSAQILNSIGT